MSDLVIEVRGAEAGGEPEIRGNVAPLPQRIEQADHVDLVQKVGTMREKRAALRAAQLDLEAAQLRFELARRDSLAADAACTEAEQRLQTKYQTRDADQYAADGTIWRAEG